MKRDGRSFDHQTLEAIRLMAVERVRAGRGSILGHRVLRVQSHDDLQMARGCIKTGYWFEGARLPAAPGRPRTLSPRQEQQVLRWINGRDPRQYGLDLGCGRDPSWPV